MSQPIAGIGRYLWQLSRELITREAEFRLYMPSRPLVGDWDTANTRVRAGAISGRAGRMLWSQTVLPWQAARDGVDVFWGPAHRLPQYLPARIARVVTIHDLVWKFAGETMRPLSRWMEARLMPQAIALSDRIIAVSHSTAQAIEEEFPSARGKVRVIPLGVTPMAAPGKRSALAPLGVVRPYFLFVGTLEPRKNLHRLLKAYARLPASLRQNTQFVLVGAKGWGGVDVAQLVSQLGVARDVVLPGYVDDAQLATLYAHAQFLAMPSLYEGFGLPLIEAMSCGVPVLTSNLSSMPEVAADAGFFVDPLDEVSIADGLARLLAEDALRQSLASRARCIASRYSWEQAARSTWQVFEEAQLERQALRGERV
nr:glycosyltransferase family 1 protein [Bordetella sp. 02P26C-1]